MYPEAHKRLQLDRHVYIFQDRISYQGAELMYLISGEASNCSCCVQGQGKNQSQIIGLILQMCLVGRYIYDTPGTSLQFICVTIIVLIFYNFYS